MISRSVVLGLMLMLCLPAWAKDDTITRDQTWRLCHRDSNCVVADAMCPGTYWAIHRKHLWDNERINERLRTVLTCQPQDKPKPDEAYCLGGVCVIR